jgi:hypothetical protein
MKKYISALVVFVGSISLAFPQTNFVNRYTSYQQQWGKAKLHLVFSQNKFASGDTAYFKAYFLHQDYHGIRGSQIIELNLVDAKGDSKSHMIFTVNEGVGYNQLAIPSGLASGHYLIVAYSNWMLNFDIDLVFKKEIEVVERNKILTSERAEITVFPEGGSLVRDVSNRLLIRTQPDSKIKLLKASGEALDSLAIDHNGFGTIDIIPEINARYFVRNSAGLEAVLPKVEEEGCAIKLSDADRDGSAKLKVSMPRSSPLRRQELVLIVTCQGKIHYSTSVRQESEEIKEFNIPKTNLAQGMMQVSLLTAKGDVLANRNYYFAMEQEVNVKATHKTTFHPRDKVAIEIEVADRNGNPIETEFSVSALNSKLFSDETDNLLQDDLAIASEINFSLKVDRSALNWLSSVNTQLIAVRDPIPWKEILKSSGEKPFHSYLNFIQKQGKIYSVETGKPLPDQTDVIFYLQHSRQLYSTRVENGKVWVVLPDLFGEDELLYLAETFYYQEGMKRGEEVGKVKIEWETDSIQLPRPAPTAFKSGEDKYADYSFKTRLIAQTYDFKNVIDPTLGNERQPRGNLDLIPDVLVNIQNYVLFPTMSELVKEVIPALQQRKRRGKDVILVNLPEELWALKSGDPVYIIDGFATKNTEFFLSLKPVDLLTVGIITDPKKLSKFGMMGKNGIVVVQTKNGNGREPLDDSNKKVEGLTRPITFKALDYSKINDLRRPDFRSTLYWNPSLKTNAQGKAAIEFYCSDDLGKMKIRIDGVTASGSPFTSTIEVDVEP